MILIKYKLKTLLFFGFGLVMLMILAFLVFITFQMNQLANLTASMYSHPLTVSNAVRDIEINIYRMNRLMKDAVFIDELSKFENTAREIDSLDKITLQKFEVVQKSFLGNPQDVENTFKAYLNWKPFRNEITQYMQHGNRVKAISSITFKSKDYVDSMLSKTRGMIEFANSKAVSFHAESISIRKSIISMVFLFSLLLIAITFAIALFITRTITQPIDKIIKNIIRISKQNFNVDIDFKGNHHLMLLESSINKLEELSIEKAREYTKKIALQHELENSQKALTDYLEEVNLIKDELQKRVAELERFQEVTIDREIRMAELRAEIERLTMNKNKS